MGVRKNRTDPVALTSSLADRIVALLERSPAEPEGWRREMADLEAESGPEVYSSLLFTLAHLDFPASQAREHWRRALEQWQDLRAALGDGVDLRVAVLHYFLRIRRKLRNPAIVEIRILQEARESAIYDELTRLYNYRYFQDRVTSEARRAQRYGAPLSLLMADADDFKHYNDTRGHLAGNVALRRLASVIRRAVREVDVVARYGGEEFAILLPSTPKHAALQVAEKVRRAVEKAGIGRADDLRARPLTVSIGVACVPGDAGDARELVDKADRALYVAKSLGKNCVRPFSEEKRESVRIDAALVGRFNLIDPRSHPLTTLNVSEGGILFQTDTLLAPGTLVSIHLGLPSASETIECVVRVVRVTEAAGGYEIGAQIVHMPRLHQRRFRFFLRQLRSPEGASEEAATA
jgi:diguanylate cyclase (GGDEF)-like protein